MKKPRFNIKTAIIIYFSLIIIVAVVVIIINTVNQSASDNNQPVSDNTSIVIDRDGNNIEAVRDPSTNYFVAGQDADGNDRFFIESNLDNGWTEVFPTLLEDMNKTFKEHIDSTGEVLVAWFFAGLNEYHTEDGRIFRLSSDGRWMEMDTH